MIFENWGWRLLLPACLAVTISIGATAIKGAELPYVQHKNIVYAERHGVALVMDVFQPVGDNKGRAVIDVASGAWHSDRGKLRDHERAQVFNIFCRKGYTVFAVRPGSISKFTGEEMLEHVHLGTRWVIEHSADYGVDAKRIGMFGASAGGHLACLAAVTQPDDSPLAAVAVFFPPTDLIKFAKNQLDLTQQDDRSRLLAALAFNGRIEGVTEEQTRERLQQLSPARRVTGNEPPFLLIHGDADKVVPLEHSQWMLEALKAKQVPAELIVKRGGGHPWLTIPVEVALMAKWMDQQLDVGEHANTEFESTGGVGSKQE